MQKTKTILFIILIALGLTDTLILLINAFSGHNSYTIANNLSDYFKLMLGYIPTSLVILALIGYLIEKILKTEHRLNYFILAFVGILPDSVFIIGTLFFAYAH